MSRRIRSMAAAAAAQLPTFFVLAALVGLAVWGAGSNWKGLPFVTAAEKKDEEKEPSIKIVPESFLGLEGWRRWLRPQLEFPSEEAVSRAGIQTQQARVQDLSKYVTAPGMVDYDPALYARLTARASGTVWRVFKEIGEQVRQGEVLALVEAADVGKYKADFLQSLTQRKLRRATLEQLRSSASEGGVPQRSLLEAEAALRVAQISLFNARQALLNLGLPLRLREVEALPEDQQAAYLRLLGLRYPWWYGYLPLRDLPTDTETLTANLLPVTAPFDAVVVQRNVATGEAVSLLSQSGRSLFVVADVHRLHADMNLNPADALKVRKGQSVSFMPAGRGPGAVAKVSHISPEVDEKTRRVRVHAEVNHPGSWRWWYGGGLLTVPRPNTFGTGRILIRERPGAVVVPADALQSDDSGSFVFVRLSAKRFEFRRVSPGLRQDNLVEVTGVRPRCFVFVPGEEVVTSGSFALKSELEKDRIAGAD